MDPAKLKVVELRAELGNRGLDTKGNKPVLVKRLREALEAESGNDIPETSIIDTSTEDLSTSNVSLSQSSFAEPEAESKEPEQEATSEPVISSPVESPAKSRSRTRKSEENSEKPKEADPEPVQKKTVEDEKMDISASEDKPAESTPAEPVSKAPAAAVEDIASEPEQEQAVEEKDLSVMETAPALAADDDTKMDTEESEQLQDEEVAEEDSKAVEDSHQDSVETEKESSEPRNRKSRWGSVSEAEPTDSGGADDNPSSDGATGTTCDEPRGEKRRHGSPSPERVARKRSRSPVKEDEPEFNGDDIQLSWIDSDLNLQVNKECFTVAEPMHTDGFGYMWAGVRSTHGVNNGKVYYEVKLLENCEWKEAPREDKKDRSKDKNKNKDVDKDAEKTEEEVKEKEEILVEPIHVFRVGWSLPTTDLQLGEQPHSYAYDSEGFSVTDSQFTEFGTKYGAGDVIGTFLNMDSDSMTISYTVNGELQPTAFTVERSELPEDSTIFPHILTRNIKFEVNFGQKEEPWFQPPTEFVDYMFVQNVETKVAGLSRPGDRKECEVMMMVGLPCSGKTYWVNNHVITNPEKKYNVLGLGGVLDKMKYRGRSRKEHFKGSTTVLMDKCTRCLGKLVDIASTRRRNYIIDQTNLFSSAQRRKMRPFDGFRRQAVVIVVADDEQSSREKSRQQADGKDVPDSAVLEMKANMCLPTVCDWLDEVTFAEVDEENAKEIVQKYNKQGREAGYGPNYTAKQSNNQKLKASTDRRNQWGRNNIRTPHSERDNGRDNRNNRWSGGSGGGGAGGGHNRQNNWGGNRGSGGWGRHDNRNHHGGAGGGGRGGDYRNNANNRMMSSGGGGGGYNRNQGVGGGGGGFNRNRNQPPHRNQMQNKGGNWGGQGGGNWNNQGSWGNQGGWGGHQSSGQGGGSGSGWSQGSWGSYGNSQGGQGGGNQQWKGGYNAQQYQQQGYAQGYPAGQYGQSQYANWNYYGQYAQGWNAQQGQQGGSGSGSDNTGNTAQYNQYTQQQQAAWAQYAQSGYGGYGQAASQGGGGGGGNAVTGSAAAQQTSATKQ